MIGNIQLFQKIGVSGDRTVYRFLNDDVIKKVSIPTEKEDAFEKMNQEMQDNFNDFVNDKKHTRKLQIVAGSAAFVGGVAGYMLSNKKGKVLNSLSTISGLTLGLLGGALVTSSNIVKKTCNYIKELSKFDIKYCEEV